MQHLNKNTKFSALFLVIILLAAFDIVFDYRHGIPFRHLLFEAGVFFGTLVGFNLFLSRALSGNSERKRKMKDLEQKLDEKEKNLADMDKKLNSLKEAFSQNVEENFKNWGFTRAEREVASLLLKGLSTREIAGVRSANENTVRSQCTSIYRKSKLANRSQLSSYFFDDLL